VVYATTVKQQNQREKHCCPSHARNPLECNYQPEHLQKPRTHQNLTPSQGVFTGQEHTIMQLAAKASSHKLENSQKYETQSKVVFTHKASTLELT
jgi:hypothetical protein